MKLSNVAYAERQLAHLRAFVAEHLGAGATVPNLHSVASFASVSSSGSGSVGGGSAVAGAGAASPLSTPQRPAARVDSGAGAGAGAAARTAMSDVRSSDSVFQTAVEALGEAKLAIADFIGMCSVLTCHPTHTYALSLLLLFTCLSISQWLLLTHEHTRTTQLRALCTLTCVNP